MISILKVSGEDVNRVKKILNYSIAATMQTPKSPEELLEGILRRCFVSGMGASLRRQNTLDTLLDQTIH